MARYKVEAEFVALNPERTKFMLLTRGEANRCKLNILGTCGASSPIYVAGSHKLFKGDKKGSKGRVPGGNVNWCCFALGCRYNWWNLSIGDPGSIRIIRSIWGGKPTRSIKRPLLTKVKLSMGCSASGMSIYPHFIGLKREMPLWN